MNIIISIKKLSVELMKLEVYYPLKKVNAQPGQYFNLSTQENAIPVKAFVDEVKNEKISLIIPHKYQNQLLDISVGDKLYSLNGPYGIRFEYKKNESILCLAEGDCVMLYSLIKALTKRNNKVTTILINASKNQVLIEKIRQISTNFQVIKLDRRKLTNNSLSLILPELVKNYNVSKLFCIGNSKTVFESLQYTKCHTKLESKIVLNTIENSDGNLQGLYNVTINPKNKFILVDGHNYSSIYRSTEQFLQKFQVKENYKSSRENISENIVHHQ